MPAALEQARLRPDPAQGLIETIAVRDGAPAHLDRHLARLSQSLAELYGIGPPAELAEQARAAARVAWPFARLRIDAVPRPGGRLAIGFEAREALPEQHAPTVLVPFLLRGGLGCHKWRDRRLLDALCQEHRFLPLLIDGDGAVLEAATANVWLLEGDALITPPADGRLLAGVTRERLLELEGACEQEMDLDRLQQADAILLSSSISGIRLASLAAVGTPRPPGGERLPRDSTRIRRLREALMNA